MTSKKNWKTVARNLVENGPYSDRIGNLLENPGLATKPYLLENGQEEFSNCHGTTLYSLGQPGLERPEGIFTADMKRLLRKSSINTPENANVVSFWRNGQLHHTGVFLGRYGNYNLLFHQPRPYFDFEFSHVAKVLDTYGYEHPDYHIVTEQNLEHFAKMDVREPEMDPKETMALLFSMFM